MTINYIPAKERQDRSCSDCIGNDSEGYYVSCWICPEIRNARAGNSHYLVTRLSGKSLHTKPCKYHMTDDEYIALIDSLEEECGNIHV